MTDRPILFSAPMIRALLAGTKTQTRRVLKPQPVDGAWFEGVDRDGLWLFCRNCFYGKIKPPYAIGDRLWVREAWRTLAEFDKQSPTQIAQACLDAGYRKPWAPIEFIATGHRLHPWVTDTPGRNRSPRHMPRWASRITLIVTKVRGERLQDISVEDVHAEGIGGPDAFPDLWNSIHGPGSWDANPWVAAVSFTVEHANIDADRMRGR